MKFWHLVKVVRSRLAMILGLAAATVVVIYVAVPKPMVVYPAWCKVSPTAQVMQGNITTAVSGGQITPGVLPNRDVVLSNLIVMARGGEVFQRAMDFLALPVSEQKRLAPGLPAYRQITRIEYKPGKVLTYRDWPEVVSISPTRVAAVGEKGTTTDIIEIEARLRDGSVVTYLANAVGYAFAKTYEEKSREDVRKNIAFLESSLRDAESKLKQMQRQMAEYKGRHRVLAVDRETQSAVESLAVLEAQRSIARAEASEAAAAVADVNVQLAREPVVVQDRLPAVMNPEVQKLKAELDKAEAELRELSLRYKPGHETYKAAEARVKQIVQKMNALSGGYSPPRFNEIRQELLKRRSEAEYRLATARAKLASIESSIAQAQEKALALAQAEPGLVDLTRKYAQQENTYRMLADKLAQAEVAEREFTKTGSIILLDVARQPGEEVTLGPPRRLLMLYGVFLALIVGVAASVWFDSIDNRMRNAADVEKLLELPVIGLTPQLTGKDGNLPKLTHIYPLSAVAESYRILRTNILFALRDTPFKTLMVATGRPGQGATTTICNLAIALAQSGKRIILIDADMRRPSLHRFFNLSNETGLSSLLQNKCKLTDAFRKTEVDNLVVIPGGPQPLNPSELLGSDRMREIVGLLQEHCDLVLFDTPSTVVFSDGPMLASWVDAVLMVVSANQAPRGTEVQTRDLLRRANANIIGVVVNRMQHDLVDSCYYYSHYYSDSIPRPALEDGRHGKGEASGGSKAIPAREQPSGTDEKADNPFPD